MTAPLDHARTSDPTNAHSAIAVFGLGYIGSVSAACLAAAGHSVVGVDVRRSKVAQLDRGETPVGEPQVAGLIAASHAAGLLRATDDAGAAVAESDLALVCVGTPSRADGGLDIRQLERVTEAVGEALSGSGRPFTVVYRSTMLPGTCESILVPILEKASGRSVGDGLAVCVHPEFLREGSAVADFLDPPKTVIGTTDEATADVVEALYGGRTGPVHRVPIRVAETVKYVDNSFHALKVAFANEIGMVCESLDLDSHEVMDVFRSDTKLNISPAYLRPGFAFGGSCLPKDLRALLHEAEALHLGLPLLRSILPSNEAQIRRVFDAVVSSGAERIALLGLSFKPGTDDLRESPLVELAERLLGRGKVLRIFDEHVDPVAIHGANREFIEQRIPHLARLMVETPVAALGDADLAIVASDTPAIGAALRACDPAMPILALERPAAFADLEQRPGYAGVSW